MQMQKRKMNMNILRMHIICIAYAEYSAKYADDVDAEYEDDIIGRTILYGIINEEFP